MGITTVSKNPPRWMFSENKTILFLFIPIIGWAILWFAYYIYIADYICYNFGFPRIFCYILSIPLSSVLFTFFILSFIFKYITGGSKKNKENKENKENKKIKK